MMVSCSVVAVRPFSVVFISRVFGDSFVSFDADLKRMMISF